MNVGQKLLTETGVGKFAVAPALGGAAVGGSYGAYDKLTNDYSQPGTIKNSMITGAYVGAGIGIASAFSSGAVSKSVKNFKQSVFTSDVSTVTGRPMTMAEQMVLGGT